MWVEILGLARWFQQRTVIDVCWPFALNPNLPTTCTCMVVYSLLLRGTSYSDVLLLRLTVVILLVLHTVESFTRNRILGFPVLVPVMIPKKLFMRDRPIGFCRASEPDIRVEPSPLSELLLASNPTSTILWSCYLLLRSMYVRCDSFPTTSITSSTTVPPPPPAPPLLLPDKYHPTHHYEYS